MNWSERVRQTHRWMSMAFTLAVVVNIVAMGMEEPPVWVYLLALLPLALLQVTGLYLFVLPYAAKSRSRRGTEP
ncbi:MAG TPA: hypothetical protein VFD82_12360 [Planctomycetota bacterium]|nr:hypothetical protein [Planctomycetota bacterium]